MTRFCPVAASLAIGALALTPAVSAAPPSNSSCMAAISYYNAQSQERDDYARITADAYDAPGRDFYRYNAKRTTAECD